MIFYRYEEFAFDDEQVRIIEKEFVSLKETPCGFWIRNSKYLFIPSKPRWISKTSRKRYAYPTKKEALNSFIARKKRQIVILEWQLERASKALQSAIMEATNA